MHTLSLLKSICASALTSEGTDSTATCCSRVLLPEEGLSEARNGLARILESSSQLTRLQAHASGPQLSICAFKVSQQVDQGRQQLL